MQKAISGVQPSNKLTLGNYLGAIKQLIECQDKYEMYIFVADLHALSAPSYDAKTLHDNKISLISSYVALGLDLKKAHVFYQSDVLTHTQLCWILTCNTMMGELTRMTQFKDKSVKVTASNGTEFIPTGIFLYPILMVADILLYDANYVIVGSDQKQHVELTRDLAERMNKRYGQIFTVPEPVIPEHGARIMDLINPTIKMSKSNANENGTIFLLDPPEKAVKKIMGAKTDSLNKVRFNPNEQPGVSNLVIIYSCFSNKSIEAIETKYKDADYGIFKKDLALLISDYLKAFQTKYQAAIVQYHVLAKQLEVNAKHCLDITSIKLNQVYRKIGLIK